MGNATISVQQLGTMINNLEISTTRFKLAALAWGDEGDNPLLAIHGWLDNAASFLPLEPFLSNFYTVALDLPGHGHSQHRGVGEFYLFLDYLGVIYDAVNQLGWDQFNLLGHSLGAGIASFYAALFPESVNKVALVEGLGPLSANAVDAPHSHRVALKQMARVTGDRRSIYTNIDRAIDARQVVGDLSRDAARLLVERNSEKIEEGITWRTDQKLKVRSPIYLTEDQVLTYLGEISCPVLLVRADSGYLHDRRNMSARYAKMKNLTIKDIPGGHHVHMEHPKAVAEILKEFLD